MRAGVAQRITQRQPWNKWRSTLWHTLEVRRPFGVPDCLSAEICGSRYLAQPLKKESLELDPLSRQPCARSMRNTWLAFALRLRPSPKRARSRPWRRLLLRAGGLIGTLNRIQRIVQIFRVLPGRHKTLSEPFQQYWSLIRIEDASANCRRTCHDRSDVVMRNTH